MRVRTSALMLVLSVALPASAQFGYPLKGTRSGNCGASKDIVQLVEPRLLVEAADVHDQCVRSQRPTE